MWKSCFLCTMFSRSVRIRSNWYWYRCCGVSTTQYYELNRKFNKERWSCRIIVMNLAIYSIEQAISSFLFSFHENGSLSHQMTRSVFFLQDFLLFYLFTFQHIDLTKCCESLFFFCHIVRLHCFFLGGQLEMVKWFLRIRFEGTVYIQRTIFISSALRPSSTFVFYH